MKKDTLFVHAHLVDPSQKLDAMGSLGVHDGRFAPPESLDDPDIIDLQGAVLAPGFIDVHVHLREPGQTHKEDIDSGTAAAANGGFTTILAMPNTIPAPDNVEHFEEINRLLKQKAHVNVFQSGCLTVDRQGKVAVDFEALKQHGCIAVSDDGSTPQDTELMRNICIAAARAGIPVIDHCEKLAFSKPGVMHGGRISRKLGLPGQSRMSEISIVRRDIALARQTGCHLHLQHISCGGTVSLLKKAREQGIPVTAEVTPHHLFLTDKDCLVYGTNAKMAPPLREEKDRLALIDAVKTGLVNIIATDHAPHTEEEKGRGWTNAPFGITGIECVVPLCLTHLVHSGIISLSRMIELFTVGPAELLALQCGTLKMGSPADITVLDPDREFTIARNNMKSRSCNCPWIGWKCKGSVVSTYRFTE